MTRQWWRPTLAIILLGLVLESRSIEKHWLGRLNWTDPKNWLGGLVPVDGSRLVFPTEMRHAVGMPRDGDLEIVGMELPRDGFLALPENGRLKMIERTGSASSKPRESRWLRDSPFFWVDPLNWDSSSSSEAVPHLERLPCQSDLVVLPGSAETFSLRLPATRDLEVRAVRLADGNDSLPRWEWRRAMEERDEFLASGHTIRYSPVAGCEDCHCQEGDLSSYWEEICNVQRPRCGIPACEYPLKVEGHCCHYCGGRVRLSGKSLASRARRAAAAALARHADGIVWHSRPTWDGHGEILLAERGRYEGVLSAVAVAELEARLREEGLDLLYSETSGGPLYDYRLAVALGPLLGGFFALLLLLLLLFPAFGYSYSQVWEAGREVVAAIRPERRSNERRKRKSFAFARFENVQEGSVHLAEREDTEARSPVRGETFENPLFGSGEPREGATSASALKRCLDPSEAISFAALEEANELDRMESIELEVGTR